MKNDPRVENLDRALVNAHLGDGFFWKHPENRFHNICWNSINRSWLEWKRDNLLPKTHRLSVYVQRKANAKGCFPNSKTLYVTKSRVDERTTLATEWKTEVALSKMDLLDMAVWFLDDGCVIERRDQSRHGFRACISVGGIDEKVLFPHARRVLGVHDVGNLQKNGGKVRSNRNMIWFIPNAPALKLLTSVDEIAPSDMRYKFAAARKEGRLKTNATWSTK